MQFFDGIRYNFKGLMMGVKTPSLLMLGLLRLVVILILTIVGIGLVLGKYQELANLVWTQPESAWLVWLWYVVAWLLAVLLSGIAAVAAFLISQLLFSVVVMDYMSRITERLAAGREQSPPSMPWLAYFVYLVKQEVPRTTVPVCVSLALMTIGWLTPLSAVLTVASPVIAGIFLAWDNTDLVPARRLVPFRERFRFLRRELLFHTGFGICFLIPVLNIVLLSFAPVGATLWYVDRMDGTAGGRNTTHPV